MRWLRRAATIVGLYVAYVVLFLGGAAVLGPGGEAAALTPSEQAASLYGTLAAAAVDLALMGAWLSRARSSGWRLWLEAVDFPGKPLSHREFWFLAERATAAEPNTRQFDDDVEGTIAQAFFGYLANKVDDSASDDYRYPPIAPEGDGASPGLPVLDVSRESLPYFADAHPDLASAAMRTIFQNCVWAPLRLMAHRDATGGRTWTDAAGAPQDYPDIGNLLRAADGAGILHARLQLWLDHWNVGRP